MWILPKQDLNQSLNTITVLKAEGIVSLMKKFSGTFFLWQLSHQNHTNVQLAHTMCHPSQDRFPPHYADKQLQCLHLIPHIDQCPGSPVITPPDTMCRLAALLIPTFTTFTQVIIPSRLADSANLLTGSRLPPPSHLPRA